MALINLSYDTEKFQLHISEDKLPVGFPMITQWPTTKVVETGSKASLHCAAVGSPVPTISWMKNSIPIHTVNSRYVVQESGKKMF